MEPDWMLHLANIKSNKVNARAAEKNEREREERRRSERRAREREAAGVRAAEERKKPENVLLANGKGYRCPSCEKVVSFNAQTCQGCGEPDVGRKAKKRKLEEEREAEQLKREAEQRKKEAEQRKKEAEQRKKEAEQRKKEAEQHKKEAEQRKRLMPQIKEKFRNLTHQERSNLIEEWSEKHMSTEERLGRELHQKIARDGGLEAFNAQISAAGQPHLQLSIAAGIRQIGQNEQRLTEYVWWWCSSPVKKWRCSKKGTKWIEKEQFPISVKEFIEWRDCKENKDIEPFLANCFCYLAMADGTFSDEEQLWLEEQFGVAFTAKIKSFYHQPNWGQLFECLKQQGSLLVRQYDQCSACRILVRRLYNWMVFFLLLDGVTELEKERLKDLVLLLDSCGLSVYDSPDQSFNSLIQEFRRARKAFEQRGIRKFFK